MSRKINEMLSSHDPEMINLGLATLHPYSLTVQEIYEINHLSERSDEGIYREPQNVPTYIKEYVFYKRWTRGGASGGSCWGTEVEQYDEEDEPDYTCLRKALKKWGKEADYDEIVGRLQKYSDYCDVQYYGNYDDYEVGYILLTEVVDFLKTKYKDDR